MCLRKMLKMKGEKVLVIGLARSGAGSANLLSNLGYRVCVTDEKQASGLEPYIRQLNPSVELYLGGYPENLDNTGLVVVSPGVPLSCEPVIKAREKGVKVIGELELAYKAIMSSELSARDSAVEPKFLAVTGTNGKSTTTTLLDLMIRKSGFKTLLGGNIGKALTEEIVMSAWGIGTGASGNEGRSASAPHLAHYDYVVAEVSSFQLETIDEFRPFGAVILNITPDHFDRYHSMEEYRDAKAAVFLNQQEDDFLVLNADDPEINKVRDEKLEMRSKKPGIFYFSRKEKVRGIYSKDGVIFCNFPGSSLPASGFQLMNADEIRIKGVHNLENAMAAAAMALLAGCSPEDVKESLKEFSGLEHRLELVREFEGVRFINDSKGTNVGAVIKSLESFKEPVILIAGGRDKAGDFSPLVPLVRDKVKALVLLGEAAEKIKKAFGGLTDTVIASGIRDAVDIAKKKAAAGDVVLLSPACASFDMFRDFEDRGRQFKQAVMGLERAC